MIYEVEVSRNSRYSMAWDLLLHGQGVTKLVRHFGDVRKGCLRVVQKLAILLAVSSVDSGALDGAEECRQLRIDTVTVMRLR